MVAENILIVEDEKDACEFLSAMLSFEGYDVNYVNSAEDGLVFLKTCIPDIIILDIMLPGINGIDFCKKIKNNSSTSEIPVIMLTSQGEEEMVVKGLESGADDYVIKQSSSKILNARIKAVLRRKPKRQVVKDSVIRIQNLIIDPNRYEAFLLNKQIDLSITEFKILHFLASKPGWVFTRGQILESINDDEQAKTDRSIDVLIASIRKKMKPYNQYIETVRGVGYTFKE